MTWRKKVLIGLGALAVGAVSLSLYARTGGAPPAGNRFFCFWWRTIRADASRCLPPVTPPPAQAGIIKSSQPTPGSNVQAGAEVTYTIEYTTD